MFESLIEKESIDPRWLLVKRVAGSSLLRGSSRLREFLLYVPDCAIRNAPGEATEQQIGIHVFGRIAGYNSSEDSIVRTHARILRQKLDAYFASEGSGEDLIIEIPKGQYLPVFRSSTVPEPPPPAPPPAEMQHSVEPQADDQRHWLKPIRSVVVIVGLILFVVSTLEFWVSRRTSVPHGDLERLWHPFLSADPPLLIYSNPLFVGDSESGLRIAPSEESATTLDQGSFDDKYTGVGEVVAVSEVTKLFDGFHSRFVLKRSHLVTWDEARSKNLIFIGAPSQNSALRVLPSTTEFIITHSKGIWAIVNAYPKPGEASVYSRSEHPLTEDYAIVALLPGAQSGDSMMVLSGLTTLGTEAAAEFVCRPDSASELVRAATTGDGKLHPFEALLDISVSSGVPLQARLLSVHIR